MASELGPCQKVDFSHIYPLVHNSEHNQPFNLQFAPLVLYLSNISHKGWVKGHHRCTLPFALSNQFFTKCSLWPSL